MSDILSLRSKPVEQQKKPEHRTKKKPNLFKLNLLKRLSRQNRNLLPNSSLPNLFPKSRKNRR